MIGRVVCTQCGFVMVPANSEELSRSMGLCSWCQPRYGMDRVESDPRDQLIKALAERVAAQAELLSKRAEHGRVLEDRPLPGKVCRGVLEEEEPPEAGLPGLGASYDPPGYPR